MKRMLMVASVPSMIGQFNMNNIKILQELGYQVDVACNFRDRSVWNNDRVQAFIKELKEKKIKTYQIDFSRSSKNMLQHMKSYKQLDYLMKKRKYDFIHCHTPIAGAIARLVAHKNNIKVIYTAHGFHFFKGAPIKNWVLYYPIERFLARYTDILITINKEDYCRAKTFKAKKVEYVPGVGVDIEKFKNCKVDIEKKKEELGIPQNAKVLLSVGELSKRKNHQIVIKALAKLKKKDIYYLICGQGKEENNLRYLAKDLGIEKYILLLGYRNDVDQLYKIADLFIFSSLQEGLPVALMEAMASGVPCIANNIRGNNDLIEETMQGTALIDINNVQEVKRQIENMIREKKILYLKNRFSIKEISNKMRKIYEIEDDIL